MSPPIAWSGPEELETVQRHGNKLLICIINDGGYGAEMHKFRAYGVDPIHAPHRRGGIAQVARGFGLNGTKVTSLGQFEDCSVRTRRSTAPKKRAFGYRPRTTIVRQRLRSSGITQ